MIEAVGPATPWAAAFRQSLGLTDAASPTDAPIWTQSAGARRLYHETVILLAERMLDADRAVALEAVQRIQEEVS